MGRWFRRCAAPCCSRAAASAGRPAQGAPAGVWVVPHALELCHAGPDVAGHAGDHVSAETMRRWVHEVDWVWKRPKLVAKDDDPRRVERLARIRVTFEQLKRSEAMVFADALDIHLWPKVGYAWMPKGTQMTVMTPGQ